jgi:hypothetical protein
MKQEEVADYLRCDASTVRRLDKDGILHRCGPHVGIPLYDPPPRNPYEAQIREHSDPAMREMAEATARVQAEADRRRGR